MALELKDFQLNALDAFRQYLESVRITNGPAQSFQLVTQKLEVRTSPYRTIPGLESVPYVCLRVPTGGGKTIMGAHAIRIAGESYIEKEFPVVLWLVPTNTIRTQTADALKQAGHPYRQALDEAFDGRVRVFDVSEIENIRPADIEQSVCVIVATIQTLRVTSTEGRKVYAHKEALEDHFSRLAGRNVAGLEKIESGPDAGKIKYSFANLMAIHRPMVIMDEAHNARTSLSFAAFERVAPSCILELTATPDADKKTGSNVLYRVSASEVKAEFLIKLPVVLQEHRTTWQDALQSALRTRKKLAALAEHESEYIRPILLIQAQDKNQPANVEVVKKYLEETELIPSPIIAVATGTQRDLEKVNLFDPACPIEIIITVEALREGWDCSFAYVFCSTANVSSATAVEQLLGRVLRMPYASKRNSQELNKAYAHVSSSEFGLAAKKLRDNLVHMGFEGEEASDNIEIVIGDQAKLFSEVVMPVTLNVTEAPNLEGLTPEEQQALTITPIATGGFTVEVHGTITPALTASVLNAVPENKRAEAKAELEAYAAIPPREPSPAEQGRTIIVPRLCVDVDGQLRLFDRDVVEELAGWNLLKHPANPDGFSYRDDSQTFVIDIEGQRVTYERVERQFELNILPVAWTQVDLVRWLDKQLRQKDIPQATLQTWINGAITTLLSKKFLSLDSLVSAKFMLVRYLKSAILDARVNALKDGYQELLLQTLAPPEDFSFRFTKDNYAPHFWYDGSYKFGKRFHSEIGDLDDATEEFKCAQALDAMPEVDTWVRNIAQTHETSFWLQTATDRFYPDFVALLKDGRVLVLEYKGDHLSGNADTIEKSNLGDLWQSRSEGRGLFLMAGKRDHVGRNVTEQIRGAITRGVNLLGA